MNALAANTRFGAMAAEARNNGNADLKLSCAAERVVETATSVSRKQAKVSSREKCTEKESASPKISVGFAAEKQIG